MYRNTVKIDGMACGMCEAHICDAIRKAFPDARKIRKAFPDARKVSASHRKKEASFLTDQPAGEAELGQTVEATGYHYLSSESVPWEKKGLFGARKA